MGGYVYILTNDRKTVLYVGVTSNLQKRIEQHKSCSIPGFTKRYNLRNLIYFETLPSIEKAISREKEIKGWSRVKKNLLIAKVNPSWNELPSLSTPSELRLKPRMSMPITSPVLFSLTKMPS